MQELLLHFHPLFAVVIVPLAGILALVAIPYLRYDAETAGPWFLTRRGLETSRTAALVALAATPLWVLLDEFVLDFGRWLPVAARPGVGGADPRDDRRLGLLAVLPGMAEAVHRSDEATKSCRPLFAAVTTAFVVLTVDRASGSGEQGMALDTWPWRI